MIQYSDELVTLVLEADDSEGISTTVEEFKAWLNTLSDYDEAITPFS